MNINISRIRALDKERRDRVKPLLTELRTLSGPAGEDKPAQWREGRIRELRSSIASTNANYAAQINAARTAGETQLGRALRAGGKLKGDALAEVSLVVEEYRGRTRQEQRQLIDAIGEDLDAGDATAATIKMRAAQALNLPVGSVAARMAQVDPAMSGAKAELDVLNGIAASAIAETNREMAHAGIGSTSQAIAAKSFAASMHLRPDAPFLDQVDPNYHGLTVRQHGFPASPFPEPYNPERDQQRKVVERIKGNVLATVEEAEERYAERR